MDTKRIYDLLLSSVGLLLLLPFLGLVAALVWVVDGRPVLFRQERVGWRGRPFRIWKFRTMIPDAERSGLKVTCGGDPRVTRLGRWLRKTKLDELPQLWNVLRGDMSLVGPRPEVSRYVSRYTPEQRKVLELRPGITDLATLRFRDEEELLREACDVEEFYMTRCVPQKIRLNLEYAATANRWSDTRLILQTLFSLGGRSRSGTEMRLEVGGARTAVQGRKFPEKVRALRP